MAFDFPVDPELWEIKAACSGLTHNIKIISTQIIANTTFEIKPEDVNPDQAALISHSSGSTGKPKAIYRSHRVLVAQHEVLNRAFPLLDNQKDFPLFPNILLHNLCNGTLSILPEIQRFKLQNLDAGLILNQLIAHQVTTLTGNVFYFRRILEHAKQHHIELKNVRALGIGGSPVSEDLVFKLKSVFVNADIYIIYGSSEAEPMAIRKVDLEKQDAANGYCVGEIVSTISIKIEPIGNLLFKNGASIPVGEIEVKGPHVAVSKHEDWLKTGDYGYVYDQKLFLTGRKGNETIYGGVQHYQVEHVLQQIEGIELAAALYSSTGFEIFIKGSVSKSLIRNVLKKNFLGDVFKKINFVEEIATDNRHLSKILYNKLASCVLSFIM